MNRGEEEEDNNSSGKGVNMEGDLGTPIIKGVPASSLEEQSNFHIFESSVNRQVNDKKTSLMPSPGSQGSGSSGGRMSLSSPNAATSSG